MGMYALSVCVCVYVQRTVKRAEMLSRYEIMKTSFMKRRWLLINSEIIVMGKLRKLMRSVQRAVALRCYEQEREREGE